MLKKDKVIQKQITPIKGKNLSVCFDKNKKILDLLLKNKSPHIEPKTSKYLKQYNKKIFITEDLNQLVYYNDFHKVLIPNFCIAQILVLSGYFLKSHHYEYHFE